MIQSLAAGCAVVVFAALALAITATTIAPAVAHEGHGVGEARYAFLSAGGAALDLGERTPHITFAPDGRAFGLSGCNRFTGTFELSGNTLTFGPLAGTRKLCPPHLMKAEDAVLQALNDTRAMRMTGGHLVLLDDNGATLAELVRDARG